MEKKKKTFMTFIVHFFIETFEFSIGLFILWSINTVTRQEKNLFETSDILVATLVYMVINLKSSLNVIYPFQCLNSEKYKVSKKKNENMAKFMMIIMSLSVVLVTLDIINFRQTGAINYRKVMIYLIGFIGIKTLDVIQETFQTELLIERNKYAEDMKNAYLKSAEKMSKTLDKSVVLNENLVERLKKMENSGQKNKKIENKNQKDTK